jgi:hypothetical protein
LFNLDLSGGFPAVIIKSLVYAQPGKILLLPAFPHGWKSGEIKGVLLRGQITMEALRWTEKEIEARLLSDIDQTVKITALGSGEVSLKRGRVASGSFRRGGPACPPAFPPGTGFVGEDQRVLPLVNQLPILANNQMIRLVQFSFDLDYAMKMIWHYHKITKFNVFKFSGEFLPPFQNHYTNRI